MSSNAASVDAAPGASTADLSAAGAKTPAAETRSPRGCHRGVGLGEGCG